MYKSIIYRYRIPGLILLFAIVQIWIVSSLRLIYSSDGSFRFFSDLISNQNHDLALNPLNYFTNRIWIDNYRQLLLALAEFLAWDFPSLKLINSIIQMFGLFGLYLGLFLVIRNSSNPTLNSLTFLPILILFPVLAIYLDAHIIWAYPIYSMHFIIYLSKIQFRWTKILFLILSLLLTGIHEFTIPYFFLMFFTGLFLLKSKEIAFSTICFRILLTLPSFAVSVLNYLLHKDEYSTLGQIRFLGILNLNNIQYSTYTFAFAVFVVTFIFIYIVGLKPHLYLMEFVGLVILLIAYSKTSNFQHSNFWVGYLLRNDFVLFFGSVFVLIVVFGKFQKPLNSVRKHFLLVVILIHSVGILMTLNYGSSYTKCWTDTQNYISKNGFSTVKDVSQFGECQVDWVAPMTSLIMSNSDNPNYLLVNKLTASSEGQSPEGRLALNVSEDGIFLPYGQFIANGFWGLDLQDLIDNLKDFGVSQRS